MTATERAIGDGVPPSPGRLLRGHVARARRLSAAAGGGYECRPKLARRANPQHCSSSALPEQWPHPDAAEAIHFVTVGASARFRPYYYFAYYRRLKERSPRQPGCTGDVPVPGRPRRSASSRALPRALGADDTSRRSVIARKQVERLTAAASRRRCTSATRSERNPQARSETLGS